MTHPPQGWYADPESAHQFRYWDGSGWTQHVAPSGPAASTAPRVWTKATAATLISCLLLVVAATAGSAELVRRAHAEIDAEPVRILEGFLGSAVRGDRGWEAFAAPRIVDEFALSNPFRGEEATARAMGMGIEYSVLDFSLSSQKSERSHYAQAVVEFTYDYAILEERHRASIVQLIWLTRPFYYEGHDTPATPVPASEPDRVGPWKVTAIGLPAEEHGPQWPERFTTSLELTEAREDDALHCGSAAAVLAEMSESSRKSNTAVSSCLYGEDGNIVGGGEVSSEDVGEVFPLIDEFSERTLPQELVHIRTGANAGADVFSPFEQYLIPAGDEEDYVLTLAPLNNPGGEMVYRVISIQELQVPCP